MSRSCPLCERPLYAWVSVPPAPGDAIGAPLSPDPARERVLDRCENCGVALERGCDVDLIAEWEAICRPTESGGRRIAIPNRASLQAAIGGEGWAAIDATPGSLLLTPRSLELLAARTGNRVEATGSPPLGRNQVWMWQTLLNGLTLHPNFAREARAGRLRPASARSRFAFFADLIASVLGGPLVALLAFPLELAAALVNRGGELTARAPGPNSESIRASP